MAAAKPPARRTASTTTRKRVVRVAVIDQTDTGNGPFIVRPSVVFLEFGDVFRLLNQSGQDLTIKTPWNTKTVPVTMGGRLEIRNLVKRQAPTSLHRYQVAVGPNRVPAPGDSDPVIIIDR